MAGRPLSIANVIKMLDDEERTLVEEGKRIDVRLRQIRVARTAMLALVGDEAADFDGKLIDAVRVVLLERDGKWLSPTEVRDGVRRLGYDFSDHPNEMAAVHGVLKRLVEYKDADVKE